ncbi:MAG TPA: TonB family protein [Rhizomicrobium sp.]
MTFTRSVRLALVATVLALAAPAAGAAPLQAGAVLIRQPGANDAAHIDGVAVLRILARPGEPIRQADLGASSGNAAFDAAALRAVRRWRYVPAWNGDLVEPEWLLVRMVYARPAAARPIRAAQR